MHLGIFFLKIGCQSVILNPPGAKVLNATSLGSMPVRIVWEPFLQLEFFVSCTNHAFFCNDYCFVVRHNNIFHIAFQAVS